MPFTVYVDVDDTLVSTMSGTVIPIPGVISHVRHLHERDAQIYCWSAGGADYAQQTAERLGIAHCFTAFLTKPHLFLDDQQPSEWPGFAVHHPSACSSSPDYSALLQRQSLRVADLEVVRPTHMTPRIVLIIAIAVVTFHRVANAGLPQVTDLDWEQACEGSNIRVTRVDGHIVSLVAFAEHYREARQWQCHFERGKIISALYRHSTVERKPASGDANGSFTTQLHDDVVATYHFPDHKLTGVPAALLEDLRSILSKATP